MTGYRHDYNVVSIFQEHDERTVVVYLEYNDMIMKAL